MNCWKNQTPWLLTLTFLAVGCGDAPEPPAEAGLDAWMVSNAERYLEDRSWRREQLERSLWSPELPYARKRLGSYGLEEGGWDLLPHINDEVATVHAADAMAGLDTVPFEGASLAPAETPQTWEAWRQLGEEVFWRMPMRRDGFLEWIISQPQLWDEVGLEVDEDGKLRGVTRFRDARGNVRLGATCGLCHGADGVAGRPSSKIDLGRARVLYALARDKEPGPYAQWGPGRVDVTDDQQIDPLAIPNIRGVAHQTHINSSGSIMLDTPAALAVRFETQYIVGHAMEARPDRRLTWALATFILSLTPDAVAAPQQGAGAETFERLCAGCHDPNRGFSGGLIPAEALVSDPLAAFSPMRGTGAYKVPSLLGVSDGGPYLHDNSQPTLNALLDSGHPFGAPLENDEKAAILDFLKNL